MQQQGWRTPQAAYASERARCIDQELDRRDLNAYGDPKGTSYPDDPPMSLKTSSERYQYVLRRYPDIGTACTSALGEPEW